MTRVELADGDWVDLVDRLSYGQQRRIAAASGPDRVAECVAAMVTGWDVRDVDGNRLPPPTVGVRGIPVEELDRLPLDTVIAVAERAAQIVDGQPDPKGTAGTSRGSAPASGSTSSPSSPMPTSSPTIPAGPTAISTALRPS